MIWSDDDNRMAVSDGWLLSQHWAGWKVFASLANEVFTTDDEAYCHVCKQAALGYELHQRALAFLTMKRLTE